MGLIRAHPGGSARCAMLSAGSRHVNDLHALWCMLAAEQLGRLRLRLGRRARPSSEAFGTPHPLYEADKELPT